MRKIFFPMIILAAMAVPAFSRAAMFKFASTSSQAILGQSFEVHVQLDTQGADINAIQGSITVPANFFSFQFVDTGSSIINFWIQPPTSLSNGEINFSGIIPGGFSGGSGDILSLVLTPIADGTGTIHITTGTILQNDGQGTAVPLTLADDVITVVSGTSGSILSPPQHSLVTPEPFAPQIEQDTNVFDGQHFLVFSTQDKGTGIDHYEVMEVPTALSWFAPAPIWHSAQSPYLLTDQSLSSNIYVRAVDHAGNFIVEEVSAEHPASSRSVITILWVFAVVIFAGLAMLFVFLRRRFM